MAKGWEQGDPLTKGESTDCRREDGEPNPGRVTYIPDKSNGAYNVESVEPGDTTQAALSCTKDHTEFYWVVMPDD